MKANKKRDLSFFTLAIVAILVLNILGSLTFFRVDLTTEKRYTLNQATKDLLERVDEVLLFKIYLEGDFPPAFQKLQRETKQMLDEFRAYNPKIQYRFIDPSESSDRKIRKQIYEQLESKGLYPIEVKTESDDASSQVRIFPGAIANYLDDRELAVSLLIPQLSLPPEAQINSSIQNLEYTLANTVRRLVQERRKSIAFIEGHGELEANYVADLSAALGQYYNIQRMNLRDFAIDTVTGQPSLLQQLQKLRSFEAAIIAKPTKPFTDLDRFLLDQYIMNGGKTLWFVDAVSADMDSLSQQSSFLATPLLDQLNIGDMLFKYGARVNTNLVKDLVAAGVNDRRSINRWVYFPMIMSQSKHPIVKDLNAIKTEFISSVDTILSPGVSKTFLLRSSPYSRTVSTPHVVSLRAMYEPPIEREYQSRHLPLGVLLEGHFESVYKNRLLPKDEMGRRLNVKDSGRFSQMLVVGDGDLVKNQLNILNPNLPKGSPLPLGFDQFTNTEFGNKAFVLNVVDYMLDDTNLMQIRSRELKIRLLDGKRIRAEKNKWMIVNTALPIGVVLIFGLIYVFLRKRRYGNG